MNSSRIPVSLIALLVTFLITPLLRAGPAAYTLAKIYILTENRDELDSSMHPKPRTAQNIRDWANIYIEVREPWFEKEVLHWENHKHDPSIKEKAKPLVMIIDLYDRVQPPPPEMPEFDTVYCSKKYAYTDEGDYVDISKITCKAVMLPVNAYPQ